MQMYEIWSSNQSLKKLLGEFKKTQKDTFPRVLHAFYAWIFSCTFLVLLVLLNIYMCKKNYDAILGYAVKSMTSV
jgi:hypothetical protein